MFNGALFGIALSVSLMLWWTSPKVFVSSDLVAVTLAYVVLAGLVGLTFVHGRVWRWDFCKQACPIGLYYSVVSPSTSYGIVFESEQNTCINCNACDSICPVDLKPRELDIAQEDVAGLALGGLPHDNHCLRCGDCVTICEFVLRDGPRGDVPLHFALGVKGKPLRPRKERV
jgi:polyferredoxin